jgi:hypothetical protein
MSDERKPTPGPWAVQWRPGHSTGLRAVIVPLADNTGVDRIAVVSGSNGDDTASANAFFIAAAPDLFAALEAQRHSDGCFCGDASKGSHSQACIDARAALAKARGEATL